MEKSIKQIADDLKINKQAVYRFVKNNHINEAHQNGQVKQYDEAAQRLIYQAFAKTTVSGEAHQTTSNDTVIDVLLKQSQMLEKELHNKNKQIDDLSEALKSAQSALNTAQSALYAAQGLHAGTIRQQIERKSSFRFWKK